MQRYEKIRLANGSTYDIVAGGLRENPEKTKLTIIALSEERTLSEVDFETDNPDNISSIAVLDSYGDEIDVKKGYQYQTGCKKQKDYVVGRELVDAGEVDEEGNPLEEYRDVIDTVFIIELSTGDIWAELNEAKREIKLLRETVDVLVLSGLEV